MLFFLCVSYMENAEYDQELIDIAMRPKFDGRDQGYVPKIRDQGQKFTCWTYASVGMAEINVLKKNISDKPLDFTRFSEDNLAICATTRNPGADPIGFSSNDRMSGNWNKGGYMEVAAETMLQWLAPSDFIFEGQDTCGRSLYIAEDVILVNFTDPFSIKKAIVKYGSVAVSYDSATNNDIYHRTKNYGLNTGLHAVLLVGWDDDIDKNLYTNGNSNYEAAPTNGGWIMKNSWGTRSGDNGYFYISYDSPITTIHTVSMKPNDDSLNLYYYDGDNNNKGTTDEKEAAAIFEPRRITSKLTESVIGVNVGIDGGNTTLEVILYTDVETDPVYVSSKFNKPESGHEAARATRKLDSAGSYTVYFEKPVELKLGQSFSIVAKVSNEKGDAGIRMSPEQSSPNDRTYVKRENQWINAKDANEYVARIKVITKNEQRKTELENSMKYATINYTETFRNGKIESLQRPTVTFNGKELKEGTDYELSFKEKTDSPHDISKIYTTVVGRREALITGKNGYTDYQIRQCQITLGHCPDIRCFGDPNSLDAVIYISIPTFYKKFGDIKLPKYWSFDGKKADDKLNSQGGYYIPASLTYSGPDANLYVHNTSIVTQIYREPSFNEKQDISTAEIEIITNDNVYDSTQKTPEIKVTYQGKVLVRGKEYDVSYTDNINAGNGIIYAFGIHKGGFFSFAQKTFKISKATDNKIVMFQVNENKPTSLAKYGETKYEYFRDKDCTDRIVETKANEKCFIRAYVPATNNYERVHSDALEYIATGDERNEPEEEPTTETPSEEEQTTETPSEEEPTTETPSEEEQTSNTENITESTQTDSGSDREEEGTAGSKMNPGIIAGIVIAVVCIIIFISVAVIFLLKRKQHDNYLIESDLE